MTVYREIGGYHGYGYADNKYGGDHEYVAFKVAGMEQCQMELFVEDIDDSVHQDCGKECSEESVNDTSPKEGTGDEPHLCTDHTHCSYGVTVGEYGDFNCGAYECYGDEQQQHYKYYQKPREFVEYLTEVVEHRFMVGYSIDIGICVDLLLEPFLYLHHLGRVVAGFEGNHQGGVEGVDAVVQC